MISMAAALDVVIANEGRQFVDDPADAGGPTKFGVTIKDLIISGSLNETDGKSIGREVIEDLTEDAARKIYDTLFCRPLLLDQLVDQRVAAVLLDQSVIAGLPTAVGVIQRVIGVKRDSVMGPATIVAINHHDPLPLCFSFLRAMSNHYSDLVQKYPNDLRFFTGWEDRVFSLLHYVFF